MKPIQTGVFLYLHYHEYQQSLKGHFTRLFADSWLFDYSTVRHDGGMLARHRERKNLVKVFDVRDPARIKP